jgi:hypothetical protein
MARCKRCGHRYFDHLDASNVTEATGCTKRDGCRAFIDPVYAPSEGGIPWLYLVIGGVCALSLLSGLGLLKGG